VTQSNNPDPLTPRSWFEAGTTLAAIQAHFHRGTQEIRIASGFFTLRGWGQIRAYTKGKRVYLLVGIDEPGEERARLALIQAIMRELKTGLDRDRRQAVTDLVERMEAGQFQILDARAQDHHAKLYLIDSSCAIFASANVSEKGLQKQIESGNILDDPQEVAARVAEFDRYFALAHDLTQELLAALKRWLELATPWDIYLKTMLALEDLQPLRMTYKKQPVSYQKDMIAQTLRQLREYDGSMLVASTGLGKTVVAIHVALHLKQEDLIDNILIIGPKAVKGNWERELQSACLPHIYFVSAILDMKTKKNSHELNRFLEVANNEDNLRWFIIIDESQGFRNRFPKTLDNLYSKRKTERRAFQRLIPFIRKSKVKVLLLSGSPYAKETENLKNQLYLLPHTSNNNRSLFEDPVLAERSWDIDSPEQFINLPVASQLTTPHVARYYGQPEDEAIYILYGEQKKYIPNVKLHNVIFPIPYAEALATLISGKHLLLSKGLSWVKGSIERIVRIAWVSSPLALHSVLKRVLDTPEGPNAFEFSKNGKNGFLLPSDIRQELIPQLLRELNPEKFNTDLKLLSLLHILNETHAKGEKAIIYCERRATVVYLNDALSELAPQLKATATVYESSSSNYEMKETREIETMIKKFAPEANESEDLSEENWDIFISTDAHGVGVNMQDASTVINYDIDWTPINPIQRAGRILRFWKEPRTVHLYTFIPEIKASSSTGEIQKELESIHRRWIQLMNRHTESTKLMDLPVLTSNPTEDISMAELASEVRIKSTYLKSQEFESMAASDISPYYQHTAKLQLHRDYAESIPSDIISAKTYSEQKPSIFVLIHYNNRYHGLLYRESDKVQEPDPVKLLDKISCEESTPLAAISPDVIEEWSDACVKAWCEEKGIPPEEVIRECALYLAPSHQDSLQILLDRQEALSPMES
jgi:superfamily II DNA or RNA helicase